MNQQP